MLGQRIQQARLAANLTLQALGNELGVTKAAIQKYEKGTSTPGSSNLLAIARACGVRTEYFFRHSRVELSGVEFRTNTKFGKKRSEAAQICVAEMAEKRIEILNAFPDPPIPDFVVPECVPEQIEALEDVDAVAERVRRAWHLGMNPIADLTAELESLGILVMSIDVEHPGFSGMTATASTDSKSYHVIAVSSRWPGDRQRFTLAHELAHIILSGRLADSVGEEAACDCFAGAFLAPAEAVVKELGPQRKRLEPLELYRLKHEYGLSMMGWLMRAFQCRVIDADTRLRAIKAFAKRGWRTHEPREALPAETPRHFEQLVYRALAEDLIAESQAARLLGMSRMCFYQERFMEPADATAH